MNSVQFKDKALDGLPDWTNVWLVCRQKADADDVDVVAREHTSGLRRSNDCDSHIVDSQLSQKHLDVGRTGAVEQGAQGNHRSTKAGPSGTNDSGTAHDDSQSAESGPSGTNNAWTQPKSGSAKQAGPTGTNARTQPESGSARLAGPSGTNGSGTTHDDCRGSESGPSGTNNARFQPESGSARLAGPSGTNGSGTTHDDCRGSEPGPTGTTNARTQPKSGSAEQAGPSGTRHNASVTTPENLRDRTSKLSVDLATEYGWLGGALAATRIERDQRQAVTHG